MWTREDRDADRSRAGAARHAVHLYDGDAELLDVLCSFASEGLAGGDSVVVVATGVHGRAIRRALALGGLDVEGAARAGRLVLVDATGALERFMVGEAPDAERFAGLFEPVLDAALDASASGRVRISGEMVDVLWLHGNRRAALQVERLWSGIVKARPWCKLLCTYLLDGFASPEDADAFREVCHAHAVVIPSGRYGALRAEQRVRHVAELERRARVLEREIERRQRVEAERARLLATESAARAEIALLYRLTDAANRAETLEQVYAAALDGIASALGVDRASILLFDPDGVLRFKAWRGLSAAYREAVEGHSPWRPEDRHPAPVLVEDVRKSAALSALLPALEREGVGAVGFFPLVSRGRLKGKFMVYHREPHAFTARERRLAGAIADQVAFAVSRRLASRERDRLLGIVGHDLRNPLGAVTMSAALLLRQALPEESARLVRRIGASARRMEGLISELLDFARARSTSGFAIQRRPADLAEIARSVLDELDAGHPGARVALGVEGEPTGAWDAERVAQVLSNLVANAIQHGGGGPVQVSVRAGAGEVVTRVHNGGEPIPPAALPGLFDPFRRGASGSTGSHLGLGLFIAREIVRAHGGRIEVASSAAEGTTFTVHLPRDAPPE